MERHARMTTLPISRQRLFFWVLFLGFANVLADKAARSVATSGWAISIGELFEVSAIVLAAITLSLILLGRSRATTPATGGDLAVALLVVLCALPPVGGASRVAVAGAALYLLLTSPRSSTEWRAAVIAASTSAYFIVGPVLLRVFSQELSFIDAWLVAGVTGLEQQNDVVVMSGQAGWLRIFTACSSLHAISLSIILPVTYSQWFAIEDWRPIVGVCATMVLATVAINVARLAALAEWPAYFDFLHWGWGASAIASATLLVMLLICFVGFELAPD